MINPSLGDIATTIATVVIVYNAIQAHLTKQLANEIKTQTNGMCAALVKVTGKREYAKGLKKGKERK
jgi:hypothetical protein